jgi:polysaccharide export outer membrane protein
MINLVKFISHILYIMVQHFFGKAFFQYFILFILFFFSLDTFSQSVKKNVDEISDDQISLFYKKAQSSGMTEAQIENAAVMQGYSASEIARVRERIAKLQMNNSNSTGVQTVDNSRRTIESADKKASQLVSSEVAKSSSSMFGESLFSNSKMSFEPDLRIATPKNYQLGPDDELNIDIFGEVLDNFKVKVSPEGTVKILNLSPIYINGLTVDAASERIISRLRQLYQGLNRPGSGVSGQVTLGNVRSIKVTITGEVKSPGTYTVSSLATVFNALYSSGGPSQNGSFRNIRVIRANKVVRVLDLYDFLLKADQTDNIHLQDQDIIRVADYDNRVTLAGQVKRPMIFEVLKGETLKDVLRFAGGFTDRAYTYTISVTRNTSRELKLLNITQDEVNSFLPQNGDKYKIGEILERFENRVEVAGAVFRPGVYALENGLNSVKELIKKAEGLMGNAYMNRALLVRKKDNLESEMISIDLAKLFSSESSDIALKREDILTIYNQDELHELREVQISGQVNKPGKFAYYTGLKLGDLILMANGFKESASFSKLELARRIVDHGLNNSNETVVIKSFTIDGSLKLDNEASQFPLEPYDFISVRTAPNFEGQRLVAITGQINYPGNYALMKNQYRISDLIELSGGLKAEGFIDGAKLYRDSTIVGVDIKYLLSNPTSNQNLVLMNGDQIVVPRVIETVKITGAVQNPIAFSFKKGYRLADYLSEAGGFTEHAIKKQVYVKKMNGISARTKRFLFWNIYPRVEVGSEIIVPAYPADRKTGLTSAEVIGLSGTLASVTISLITLIRLLN